MPCSVNFDVHGYYTVLGFGLGLGFLFRVKDHAFKLLVFKAGYTIVIWLTSLPALTSALQT